MRFKRVYIEISNLCNLHCRFCSPLKREPRRMQEAEFQRVIEEIKPFSSFVYFHVKGEPLLHPELERFLDIAYENGIRVNLTTNGTLLVKRQELLLQHPGVRQVNLSLHSFSEQEGIDGESYLQTAVNFSRRANEQGIYCVLRLWNLDGEGRVGPESQAIMQRIERAYGLEEPLAGKMRARDSVKIDRFVHVDWEEEFVWPSMEQPLLSEEGYCYGMLHQIAILADGTVVPCCLDANGEAPLGNLFQQPFARIVESEAAQAIRRGFQNRKAVHPLCRRCSFRLRFG